MTVKEYLNQAYKIDKQISSKLKKAEMLRKSLYGRGLTPSYDSSERSRSSSGDTLGKAIAAVMDAEQEADILIDQLVALRVKAGSMIDSISNEKQRNVLEHHYLRYQSDKQIAEELGYCRQHVNKLLNAGLEALEKEVTKCDNISLDILKCV
jgi:DNA-directed RNA polymerase specialized sigma24 family protein